MKAPPPNPILKGSDDGDVDDDDDCVNSNSNTNGNMDEASCSKGEVEVNAMHPQSPTMTASSPTSTSQSACKPDPEADPEAEAEAEASNEKPKPKQHYNPWKKTVTFAHNTANASGVGVGSGIETGTTGTGNGNGTTKSTKTSFKDIMMQEEQKRHSKLLLDGDYDHNDLIGEDIMNQIQSMETEEEKMIRLAIEASLKDIPALESASSASASAFESTSASASASASAPRISFSFTNRDHDEASTAVAAFASVPTSDSESDSVPPLVSPTGDEYDGGSSEDGHGLDRDHDHDDHLDEDMKLAIRLSLAEMNTNSNSNSHTNTGDMDMNMSMSMSMMSMDMDVKPSAEEQMKMKMMAATTPQHSNSENEEEDDRKMSPVGTRSTCTDFSSLDDTFGHCKPAAATTSITYDVDVHGSGSGSGSGSDKHIFMADTDNVAASAAAAAATSATSVAVAAASASASTTSTEPSHHPHHALSQEEQESITRAILAADDAAEAQSLKLAMELQAEEDRYHARREVEMLRNNNTRSNVRTVTRSEFEVQGRAAAKDYNYSGPSLSLLSSPSTPPPSSSSRKLWGQDDYDRHNEYYGHAIHWEDSHLDSKGNHDNDGDSDGDGFQINSSTPNKTWSKIDRNTIVGPNNEIRTKHDVALKNKANADRLLSNNGGGGRKSAFTSVSDAAYNSFNQSVKNAMKRSVVKGVERSGTGRAENMNEKTRGGAMDGNVRLLITRAINNGLIRHCNGVVKEGKEAIVYHAEANDDDGSHDDDSNNKINGDFDVAVKVFKRIQEFKGRGEYMDNDPRYHGKKFRNAAKREQVELWAEKEYRNLIRASRGGVPVPLPIMQKENVLFMRFLGENGWPAPQLRELELKRGSKKWTVLYCQTCMALRRLYHCARLVHADISEYNILVCPMSQVFDQRQNENGSDELQIVLIDFGQAVERNHPSAMKYLRRDLSLIRSFFAKQHIETLTDEECEEFIVKEPEVKEDGSMDNVKDVPPDNIHGNVKEAGTDNDTDEDDDMSAERSTEWRHNIKGWDQDKDLAWLEERLANLKKNAKN